MRICVFGAGAIGGFLAAQLAGAGVADLSIVARGAHLEAIRRGGLTLIEGGADDLPRHPGDRQAGGARAAGLS